MRLRFGMLTVLTNIRSTKANQGVMVGGRRPLVEDNFWGKTTLGGRQPSVEDDLHWKTTFVGSLYIL